MRTLLAFALCLGSINLHAEGADVPVIYVNVCQSAGFESGVGAVIQGESVYWDADASKIDGVVPMESEEGMVVVFCTRPIPHFDGGVDPLPPDLIDPVSSDNPFGPAPQIPDPYYPEPIIPQPFPEPGFAAPPFMGSSAPFGF